MKGSLEKNIYDSLTEYFTKHKDQEVLVLHGFEIMDLDTLERKDRFGNMKKVISKQEKDVIVINLTFRYILTIEAKTTLDGKLSKSALP